MTLVGVPGMEARHVWNGPSTVILNDSLSGFPRYPVTTIGGFRSSADVDLVSEKNTGREGERPRFSLRGGKTITYEGSVEAGNLVDLRNAEDALLSAFWDTVNEYPMTMEVRVDNAWVPIYTYSARAVSVDGPETQAVSSNRESYGFERSFIVTLRMSDARFYSVDLVTATTGSLTLANLGIVPPFIPPVTWDSGVTVAAMSVVNEGSAPADPVVDIYGPCSGPVIKSDTLGTQLALQGADLLTGQVVTIDFKERTVLLGGTTDWRKYLIGDWWDRGIPGLPPLQSSDLRLTADFMDVGARADIRFYPSRY